MKFFVTYILQLCLNYLRKSGDVRMVYDNPQGTLTFQGNVKYARKLAVPKKAAS